MQSALEAVPGVESVTVDVDAGKATVTAKGVTGDLLTKAVNAVDGGGRFTASVQ